MHKKHVGASSQLRAELWLLEQGYEVFRNVSGYGPIDLIAVKGDQILKLDVKTARNGNPSFTWVDPYRLKREQGEQGIKALLVRDDGSFEIL